MPSIKYESLVDKAAAFIRASIHNGQLKPNERLFEVQIARQIGVSRAPVREAFRILENEGMVEAVPRKGVRIRKYSVQDIENIYTLRVNLDTLATKISVPKLTTEDIDQIDEILKKMKKCVKNRDLVAYNNLNSDFHNFFYIRTQNNWLCQINYGLMNHIKLLRTLSIQLPGRLESSYAEHEEIVEAIKQGKPSEVADKMYQHMIKAWKWLSSKLPETSDNFYPIEKTDTIELQRELVPPAPVNPDSLNLPVMNLMTDLEKSIDKPTGIYVRKSIRQERDMPLERYPLEFCCVKRFDLNELLFIDVKQNISVTNLKVAGLGFLEFQSGGVLERGAVVIAEDEIIGEVAGIVEQHFPSYLGIVVRSALKIQSLRSKLYFGRKVLFVPKEEKRKYVLKGQNKESGRR